MKNLADSNQQLAEFFSHGNFNEVFPHLSENVIWRVVGENTFEGKSAVIDNCNQTAEYFKSVETEFKTNDIIVADNKVVVTGWGKFFRDGEQLNFISACDVYEFNSSGHLLGITSYCIPEK